VKVDSFYIRTILFGLFVVLFQFAVLAQADALRPRIEFFSIPNSSINSEEISDIKVDADGYVWVVSFKGLYRFDGQRFQKISTNYNSFGSLIRFYEGNHQEKFVIDYWGAIYFIRNDSMFPFSDNSKIREYYKSYGYSDVSFDDSVFHFSYHSSGYKISNKGIILTPKPLVINPFSGYAVRLREHNLPFMFTGETAKEQNADSVRFFLFDQELTPVDSCLIPVKKQNNPTAKVKLGDGTFLYSSGKGDLVHFSDKEIIEIIEYPDEILQLFTDKDNNLWLSTRGGGIHFYKEGSLDYSKKSVFLPQTSSIVAAQDYQGGIWLYSQEKGLGYISHPNIQFLETKNNVRPLVETLISGGGRIYYGDGDELFSIQIDTAEGIKKILKVSEQMMRLDFDDYRKRLWIATRGDLYSYQKGKLENVKNFTNQFSGTFSYLNSDWVDTSISLIATNGDQYFVCKNDSISFTSKQYDQKLKGVIYYRDTFYINSGNGIYVETKDTSYYLGDHFPIAKNSASQVMLFENRILFSFPSDGIHYLTKEGFIPIKYNDEILPTANLIKTNEQSLWAISHYGCFKLSVQSGEIKVRAYSALPRLVLKTGAILNDNIYLQTRNNGIGIVATKSIEASESNLPKLLITKVQTKARSYFSFSSIEPISYQENNIEIYFNSLNYHDLDVDYRYRLNGVTDDWTTTKTGYVNYVSLSANDYAFEVQSRFGLGNWSSSESVSFSIIPPIWQRWWFILSVALFFLFVIYQALNYRFKINTREKLLIIDRLTAEQKALRTRMDPHFMFNVLSSLQYLILRKKNDQATAFLNRFSSLLRSTLNHSDSEYVTIKEELKFLEEYIRLEKMRLEDAFEYKISVDPKVDQTNKIPPFILQPFLENSIQHGLRAKQTGGLLQLKFIVEEDYLIIEITDNGMGYLKSIENKTETKKHKSLGIQTINQRLKIYNGEQIQESVTILDMSSIGETGTRVTVLIKLIK
jgi:ligand-binding sensor domain-containing protein